MQEYLQRYAFDNATWPALIDILDRKSEHDLKAWSDVWVNTPGRPDFTTEVQEKSGWRRSKCCLSSMILQGLSRTPGHSHFLITALSDEFGDFRFPVLPRRRPAFPSVTRATSRRQAESNFQQPTARGMAYFRLRSRFSRTGVGSVT